jgi:hypothetical protein
MKGNLLQQTMASLELLSASRRRFHIAERSRQLAAEVLAIGILLTGCAEKPVLELQQAREAVAMALDVEADIYAAEVFEMAVFNLESGEFALAAADRGPFWSRNYGASFEYLALAAEQAEQARSLAEANKAATFEQARVALPAAKTAFQMTYEAVEAARTGPIPRSTLLAFDDELAGILATLELAEDVFDEGDYSRALALFEEVQARVLALESRARLIVDSRP